MSFYDDLEKVSTEKTTENGAATYSSTLNKNLDYFGLAGAMRSRPEQDIRVKFQEALTEHPETALRSLVHLRNIRNGGLGERYAFRASLLTLLQNPGLREATVELSKFVSELGRWDDVVYMYKQGDKEVKSQLLILIGEQLAQDIKGAKDGESISLLAKWLPSVNTSNKDARATARELADGIMGSDEGSAAYRRYRKTLSMLRNYLDVVERKMSANQWDQIDYSKVPSQAAVRYRKAFYRNDEERYEAYLEGLSKGETKVNASVSYPYEIVRPYLGFSARRQTTPDTLLEEAWKSLPDYIDGSDDRAIVVADVSGSMFGEPMEVSVSLAIYCAERLKGDFANRYITFHSSPKLHSIDPGATLMQNVQKVATDEWGQNTDVNKVFELVLETAVRNNMSQDEIPNKIVIISDMEFDRATRGGASWGWLGSRGEPANPPNFDYAKEIFEQAGYELPQLVFWNVDARNDTLPVRKGEGGTALVSGLSPSIFTNVLGGNINDPVSFMNEVLYQEKYDFVKEIAEKM